MLGINEEFNVKGVMRFIKDNNLSIDKFCKLAKISKSPFYKFIKNDFSISMVSLFKIAKASKLQAHEIFIKKDAS